MWHVLKLSLTALCCLVSRWRGAPSHPASAHSWHPGRRQLSRDPWDEATSGRSHEEAGVSGTRFNCDHVHTRLHFSLWFTDKTPLRLEKECDWNIVSMYLNALSWSIGVFMTTSPPIDFFYRCKLSIFQPFAPKICVLVVILIWHLQLSIDSLILQEDKCTSPSHLWTYLPLHTSIYPFSFHSCVKWKKKKFQLPNVVSGV